MSRQTRTRRVCPQPGQRPARFYLAVVLSILLILAGIWALWRESQDSAPEQAAASRFSTPAPQMKTAPEFALQTLEGDTLTLSDYRGRVVLLNTWATWCPPCLAEMPDLEAYYRKHQGAGFVVLAVNSQESSATVAAFLAEHDFTFPVLLDPAGTVMRQYGVRGLPTSFFIDRDGALRGVWSGQLSPARLKELVDPLL